MRGKIIRLIDEQEFGTIAAEDGADYVFERRSLIDVTFGELHVGAVVSFTPIIGTVPRAEAVRLVSR